jgi:hypothetical protein
MGTPLKKTIQTGKGYTKQITMTGFVVNAVTVSQVLDRQKDRYAALRHMRQSG